MVFNWDNDAPKKYKDAESQIKEILELKTDLKLSIQGG
jgi:hypothetical protein